MFDFFTCSFQTTGLSFKNVCCATNSTSQDIQVRYAVDVHFVTKAKKK